MKRIFTAVIIAAAAAAAVAACSPKLYGPEVVLPERYFSERYFSESYSDRCSERCSEQYSESYSGGCPSADTIGIRWWEAFGDTLLDSLVECALRNNRNILSSLSAIEQARAQRIIDRSAYLPSIGIGRVASADYTAADKVTQTYSFEPSLSWELSLFGTLRNTDRAARAAILESEWASAATGLSLAAEVTTTYFTLLEYLYDLEIARRSVGLRTRSAALVDSMFRYGMSTGVALEQARSMVTAAEADIAQYERSVDQTVKTLNVLTGQTSDIVRTERLDPASSLRMRQMDIPSGIPSDLLHRRPDIMQSYFVMQSAAAKVGIAHSLRFPSVSLTAEGGTAGSSLKNLVSGKPWAWSFAASIVETLFSFGKLKRQEQVAREVYRQSLYAYEQSVIQALAEVEEALSAIATYRTQADAYAEYVESNARIVSMTAAMYRAGMDDYLSVIDAERTYYESQMQMVNLRAGYNIACVNLIKALGGGFGY